MLGRGWRGVRWEERAVEGEEGLGGLGMHVPCSQRQGCDQDRSSLRASHLLLLLDRVISL